MSKNFSGKTEQAKPANSKLRKIETKTGSYPSFSPPPTSKIFKTEEEINSQIERETSAPKQPVRIINPDEILLNQPRLGERKTDPTGRDALTWENPQVLLGQTVKGRY